MAEQPEDFEDVIVRALSEPEFADGLRALHHRHLRLDANARHFIAKQVVKALGLERVLPGTVRRVTRPWAGLALSEEELKSVYVEDESITQNADQRRAVTIYAPIPVIDSDPIVLGEHLREVTFVGEGYGCYETFDVRPDAEDLGHEEAMKFFEGDTDPSADWPLDVEQYEGRRFRYQGLTIDCFWFWDGDGVLAFRITHPLLGLLRTIENDDCKKSYCWEDRD